MTALAELSDVEAVTSRSIQDPADITNVERLIELVSAAAIRRTGQQIIQVVNDVVTVHPHDGVARLPQHPVTAISSIVVRGLTVDAALYEFQANGYLRRLSPIGWNAGFDSGLGWATTEMYNPTGAPIDEWGWPPLPMTITYTHGYPAGSFPDDLAMVVAEVAAAKWLGGERAATGVITESIDTYRVGYYKSAPIGAWLPEHKEILDSYRRSKFASVRMA